MLINNKYIFFGTPEFAAIVLERLIKAGLTPLAVICNPDKPVGRKKIITSPPTKILAGKYKIPVLQLEKLELEIFEIQPDFAVVAAYSKIIPKEILDIPKLGVVGVHPSLLPKYRGPSPIQTAILNEDEATGVTLYLMDEKVDHGPILKNQKSKIKNQNYEELNKELADLGADLLIETLPKFIKGEITPLPQDEGKATYTKKFKIEDAFIKPRDLEIAQIKGSQTAIEIDRKIRALNPEPGTWTILDTKRTKLLEAKIIDEKLKITKIQAEGKKPIAIL